MKQKESRTPSSAMPFQVQPNALSVHSVNDEIAKIAFRFAIPMPRLAVIYRSDDDKAVQEKESVILVVVRPVKKADSLRRFNAWDPVQALC